QFSDYFTYLQSDTIVRPSSLTRRSSVLTAATISSGVAEVRDTGTDAGGVLAQPAARTAASTVKAWIGFMRTTRWAGESAAALPRSEEHTSELQSRESLVCRPLLEKKKTR